MDRTTNQHMSRVLAGLAPLIVMACLTHAQVASAQLRADQVLVLYNVNVPESRQLATYYADQRHIDPGSVIGIPLPDRETISAAGFKEFRDQLRTLISQREDRNTFRCIAVIYGVPLKIGRPKPTRMEQSHRNNTIRQLKKLNVRIAKETLKLAASLSPRSSVRVNDQGTVGDLKQSFAAMTGNLQANLLSAHTAGDATKQAALLRLVMKIGGASAARKLIDSDHNNITDKQSKRTDQTTAIKEEIHSTQQEFHRARKRLFAARAEGPIGKDYNGALEIVQRWEGLLGKATWLEEDVARLNGEECHAAFDSELSLLLWPPYSPYRWQPNLLNPDVASSSGFSSFARTIMVSRIDAPSLAIAKRMIDDAIATERTGLYGKFFIDTRGIKKKGLFKVYDENLLQLYKVIQNRSKFPVQLDTSSKVFPAGSCPDAALYCGWYSLANYVPAFDFNQGAVAYHIASFELRSLHDSKKKYWCAELLRAGVTATLGPTNEPYLHAFPPPRQFFALLMSGRYSLAECFYLSKPFNSWQLALLGDPLYRPFATNPAIDLRSGGTKE